MNNSSSRYASYSMCLDPLTDKNRFNESVDISKFIDFNNLPKPKQKIKTKDFVPGNGLRAFPDINFNSDRLKKSNNESCPNCNNGKSQCLGGTNEEGDEWGLCWTIECFHQLGEEGIDWVRFQTLMGESAFYWLDGSPVGMEKEIPLHTLLVSVPPMSDDELLFDTEENIDGIPYMGIGALDLVNKHIIDNTVIGYAHFLGRGEVCTLLANSNTGKTVLLGQAGTLWSLGYDCLDIPCQKPLKILLFENEDGAARLQMKINGIFEGLELNEKEKQIVNQNFKILPCYKTGKEFISYVETAVRYHKPDLILIDPFQNYTDGDICNQRDMKEFLSGDIGRIAKENNLAVLIAHHYKKPTNTDKETYGDSEGEGLWMYKGAGSNFLVTYPRAIMVLNQICTNKDKVNPKGKFKSMIPEKPKYAYVLSCVKGGEPTRVNGQRNIQLRRSSNPLKPYWTVKDSLSIKGISQDAIDLFESQVMDAITNGGCTTKAHVREYLEKEGLVKSSSFYNKWNKGIQSSNIILALQEGNTKEFDLEIAGKEGEEELESIDGITIN